MGFLDGMDTSGGGTKRPKTEATSPEKQRPERKGHGGKLMVRGMKTALSSIRRIESELERAFLFLKDSEIKTALGKAMKAFQECLVRI